MSKKENPNTVKILNHQDLYGLLNYTKNYHLSSDNIYTYSQSPIHAMVYHEMMKYSKEELEQVGNPEVPDDDFSYGIFGKHVLLSLVWQNQNPLFFSALLKKGCFLEKMTPTTNWLIKEVKEPSFDLYQTIFVYEEHMRKKNRFKDIIYDKDTVSSFILDYAKDMDTEEKKEVLDKYFFENRYEDKATLLSEVFNTVNKNKASLYLLEKMKNEGWDINEGALLNNYLPSSSSGSFFISSDYFKDIQQKIELGFKFDEENYDYKGKTLMTAVLDSGRIDICNLILPHLKRIHPIDRTIEEQTQLLEKYKDKNDYKKLKLTYSQIIVDNFNKILPQHNNEKTKVKI